MTRAYVGTYAAAEEPGIYALEFDETSGTFEIVGAFSGVENPSFLAVRDDLLLAVGETGRSTGSVHAFRLTGWPPQLELLGAGATNGDYPCHLSIDATGRWVAAANYGTGNVVVLPVTAGDFGEVSSEVQHGGRGPNESRQEGPHAHCALFSPGGRFVVAADLGIDRILVYGFDEVGGRLTYQTGVATLPGAGPRHVAFHPNAPVMFGVNELDNALVVYDFDRDTGGLRVR
ncbi:MAG: lactonase family protein, partial [Acidimicrobiia bacterium]|nr:lactonase family protein [Acidimicrobiia bacterium]